MLTPAPIYEATVQASVRSVGNRRHSPSRAQSFSPNSGAHPCLKFYKGAARHSGNGSGVTHSTHSRLGAFESN